ncbi:hypothetical protein O181_013445 [Austropuccinia psidii MF-1]|uniref:Uncharacterized protein n=1 Tax=Austropuccinia psidii MF-1 TaxID=1389203 RepID=A0A9Q3BZW7_9BASI|nr:hypothetical protein [Austropuccinia psidii MF-1]
MKANRQLGSISEIAPAEIMEGEMSQLEDKDKDQSHDLETLKTANQSLEVVIDSLGIKTFDFLEHNKTQMRSFLYWLERHERVGLTIQLPTALLNRPSSSLCCVSMQYGRKVVQTKLLVQLRSTHLPRLERHLIQLASLVTYDSLVENSKTQLKLIENTIVSLTSVIESLMDLLDIGFRMENFQETTQKKPFNLTDNSENEVVTLTRFVESSWRTRELIKSISALPYELSDYLLSTGLLPNSSEDSSEDSENGSDYPGELHISISNNLLETHDLIDWLSLPECDIYCHRSNQAADELHNVLQAFQIVIKNSEDYLHQDHVKLPVAGSSKDHTQPTQSLDNEGRQIRQSNLVFETREAIHFVKIVIPIIKLARLMVDYVLPSKIRKRARGRISSFELFSQFCRSSQPTSTYCSFLEFLSTFGDLIDGLLSTVSFFFDLMQPDQHSGDRQLFCHQVDLMENIDLLDDSCNKMTANFDRVFNALSRDSPPGLLEVINQDRERIKTWSMQFRLYTEALSDSFAVVLDKFQQSSVAF